jgi:Scavenger receptor cysteine-rich domain
MHAPVGHSCRYAYACATLNLAVNRCHEVKERLRPSAFGAAERDGQLRLAAKMRVGATTVIGRPEVAGDGGWKISCQNAFTNADAMVACRALGFNGGLKLPRDGPEVANLDLIPKGFLDTMCNGTEASFEECPPFDGSDYDYEGPPRTMKQCSSSGTVVTACSGTDVSGAQQHPHFSSVMTSEYAVRARCCMPHTPALMSMSTCSSMNAVRVSHLP